mmetsp:Transcript_32939/g.70130  ORF Transcript_32939/g.70130 Transcript_32939/m.70130 type:complete len:266 (-) Transcript_32939:8-805(-)
MIFSSRTLPKALVMTKPGDFSCPQARPLVRMEETRTTFLMPAALAASISLQVPTLSTSCAAAFILRGFPGTNPTAMTRDWAPSRAEVIDSVVSETSNFLSSTPAASKLGTFWTIAPRTTVLLSPRAFCAFSTLRTPATTASPGCAARRSRMRRPVCPVAPATTTVGAAGGAAGASPSALAARGRRRRDAAAVDSVLARTSRRDVAAPSSETAGAAKRAAERGATEVESGVDGARKAAAGRPRRRRDRVAAIFIVRWSSCERIVGR